MHLPLLKDILLLLVFSVFIVFLLQRLRLPSIIGLLVTGVVIGPYGLSIVKAVEAVELLAEIGVILLLFVIGMELSLRQLASILKTVFLGGLIQVSTTVLVSGAIYHFLGYNWNEAVFVGFLFSLSSTAIVLKTLQDRNQINTMHGRNALAILIFQDLIVVPMMLFTPLLAGESTHIAGSIGVLLVKSLAVLLFSYLSATYIAPRLMHAVAMTNSKELFLLVTITLCLAVAFLTSEAGLSLALGAFIAGLIVSESEYSHQAISIILPFRELFTSFFFVSIGMLLDLSFFLQQFSVIMLLMVVVFVVKSGIAAIAIAILRYPPRTVLLTGLSLFQIGEFAFILSKVGIEHELIGAETNQYFLSVSILSMILTPFVIIASGRLTDRFLGLSRRIGLNAPVPAGLEDDVHVQELNNHLVIIGFGINGSNLSKAARASDIPYVVVEMDAELVRRARSRGIPILYGDAAQDHILEKLNLSKARAAVVAISDDRATKAIIKNIRWHSESVYLLVRTRYVKEMKTLLALGADEVVPEEFETSLQIFSRVMQNFLVPEDDIEQFVDQMRSDNYQLFQSDKTKPRTFRTSEFSESSLSCLSVQTDSGSLLHKPISELHLTEEYGVHLLGIKRRGKLIDRNLDQESLKQGDVLYVLGMRARIDTFQRLIK